MVFYFFVYHQVAQKARKVEEVRLSNGKVVSNVRSVNGLMQQKAMPVSSVKFEGWFAQPVQEDEHPLLHDETLAETLARHNKQAEKEQKELEALERGGKKRSKSTGSQKKSSKFGDSIVSSESSSVPPRKKSGKKFAGCLVEEEDESSMVEPNFNPPMKIVSVGSSAGRGCMKVRTQQESLQSSPKLEKASDHGSSVGKTESTCSSSSSVHFGTVEIRSYSYCLGDNPACSSGPPISLDWKYREVGAFPVDEYNDCREPDPPFQITNYDRVELLRSLGYTREELREAEKQRKKDQAMREETIYRLKFMERDEKKESVKRKLKTALRLKAH